MSKLSVELAIKEFMANAFEDSLTGLPRQRIEHEPDPIGPVLIQHCGIDPHWYVMTNATLSLVTTGKMSKQATGDGIVSGIVSGTNDPGHQGKEYKFNTTTVSINTLTQEELADVVEEWFEYFI
jgi:hypothetical protein